MDPISRALGRLESQAVETNRRLKEIEKKQDSILAWRWKVAGISCSLSVAVGALFDIAKHFI